MMMMMMKMRLLVLFLLFLHLHQFHACSDPSKSLQPTTANTKNKLLVHKMIMHDGWSKSKGLGGQVVSVNRRGGGGGGHGGGGGGHGSAGGGHGGHGGAGGRGIESGGEQPGMHGSTMIPLYAARHPARVHHGRQNDSHRNSAALAQLASTILALAMVL